MGKLVKALKRETLKRNKEGHPIAVGILAI